MSYMANNSERQRGNPIDASGKVVAFNIRRHRQAKGIDLRKLESLLSETRPISASALSKIENRKRSVDVDDLVALAVALDVTPNALLLPPVRDNWHDVTLTGYGRVSSDIAWDWVEGKRPLQFETSREKLEGLRGIEAGRHLAVLQEIEGAEWAQRLDPRDKEFPADFGPGVYAIEDSFDAHGQRVSRYLEVPRTEDDEGSQ